MLVGGKFPNPPDEWDIDPHSIRLIGVIIAIVQGNGSTQIIREPHMGMHKEIHNFLDLEHIFHQQYDHHPLPCHLAAISDSIKGYVSHAHCDP